MKIRFNKLKQNKGFTLLELLVALAVSSVVILIIGAFITQGTRFFNQHSNSINLQNELQELSNVITDSVQEASYLELDKVSGLEKKFHVLTGKTMTDKGKVFFETSTGTEKDITWEEGKPLYIFDSVNGSDIDAADKAGYAYSSYVTRITLSIDDSCKVSANQYLQPLILKLDITVGHNKEERTTSKTITLRNTLSGLKYGEKTFVLGENNALAVPTSK